MGNDKKMYYRIKWMMSQKCEYPKAMMKMETVFAFLSLKKPQKFSFTTGTTGKSKGIELTYESVIAVSENVIGSVEMKKDSVELIPVPLSHSHGLRRYYSNILNGGSVVIIDGVIFTKKFFGAIEKYHVTAIDLVPAKHWRHCSS